jgi:hypothetical protein
MPRKFSSTSVDTTIVTTPLAPGDTSVTVASAADLTNGLGFAPGDTFVVALSPDTAAEEVCVVTGVSSNTLTLTRGQAGTSATTHAIGTVIRHVLTSLSLTDFETARNNQVDKTTINAKGDLLAGTANDTIGRLGVGTNGQVLTADSTQTTGLNWTTPSDITASSSTTFTNKTISLANNTVTGTTAQFNTALSDGSFATLAGAETLTSKNVRLAGVDEKTANYTLVVGDAGKLISVNSSSNLTVTVPSGVFSAGDVIYVTRTGTGTVTIAASGTTLTSPDSALKLRVRYSSIAIICTASNTFRVVGDLSA